jgi:DNA-binding PadR family transcriptional regulator
MRPQVGPALGWVAMESQALPELSCGEWAILGLVNEQPRHGFALARLMLPEGEVGRVWALPKPLVYRALATLEERGLVTPVAEEPGDRGPHRTLHAATPRGIEALSAWLAAPVEHLREVRSLLMLKLALLARSRRPVEELLAAQRERLAPLLVALETRVAAADDFERTLLMWRLETARAVMRFLDAAGERPPGSRDERPALGRGTSAGAPAP